MVQSQRCEVHQKEDAERGWTQGTFKNVQRRHRQGGEVNTHNRYQALSILENIREEDEAGNHIYLFNKSDNGKWVRDEVVVDSGAVECVTSKKRMPHMRVEKTPEPRRGETWTCAGGSEIKKEGKVTVNWRTDSGTMMRGVFKVGPVSRTLINVDRLQQIQKAAKKCGQQQISKDCQDPGRFPKYSILGFRLLPPSFGTGTLVSRASRHVELHNCSSR